MESFETLAEIEIRHQFAPDCGIELRRYPHREQDRQFEVTESVWGKSTRVYLNSNGATARKPFCDWTRSILTLV